MKKIDDYYDENDFATRSGIPPEILKYIEAETHDIFVSSHKLAKKFEIDQKQAFWSMVMLYGTYYNR